MNLRLPICPRCNDTKATHRAATVMLFAGGTTQYVCDDCNLRWWGSDHHIGTFMTPTVFGVGNIEEERK